MLDNRIYTFLAVCQEMNFTRAAKKLHITHTACCLPTHSVY